MGANTNTEKTTKQDGTARFQPTWWKLETHESAWDRIKEALRRDWEQTKADFGGRAPDLNQGVEDTVKQAAGTDAIPGRGQPNVPGGTPAPKSWDRDEESARYGVGAHVQYGKQYPTWSDELESTLSKEWEEGKHRVKRDWQQVKTAVRRGYEAVASQKLL